MKDAVDAFLYIYILIELVRKFSSRARYGFCLFNDLTVCTVAIWAWKSFSHVVYWVVFLRVRCKYHNPWRMSHDPPQWKRFGPLQNNDGILSRQIRRKNRPKHDASPNVIDNSYIAGSRFHIGRNETSFSHVAPNDELYAMTHWRAHKISKTTDFGSSSSYGLCCNYQHAQWSLIRMVWMNRMRPAWLRELISVSAASTHLYNFTIIILRQHWEMIQCSIRQQQPTKKWSSEWSRRRRRRENG